MNATTSIGGKARRVRLNARAAPGLPLFLSPEPRPRFRRQRQRNTTPHRSPNIARRAHTVTQRDTTPDYWRREMANKSPLAPFSTELGSYRFIWR